MATAPSTGQQLLLTRGLETDRQGNRDVVDGKDDVARPIASPVVERLADEGDFSYKPSQARVDAAGRRGGDRGRRILRLSDARHLRHSQQHFGCQWPLR